MPTPEGLNTTTIHMQFVEPDSTGTPLQGTLTFSPNPSPILFPTQNVIVAGTETATLDVNGEATITLISTDQAGENPTGWLYSVTERIIGQKPRTYNISLPYTSGMVVELSDIVPTDVAPNYIPVVGPQGPPGVITTINGKSAAVVNLVATDLPDLIPTSQKGAASGVATLTAAGKHTAAEYDGATVQLLSGKDAAGGYIGITAGGRAGVGISGGGLWAKFMVQSAADEVLAAFVQTNNTATNPGFLVQGQSGTWGAFGTSVAGDANNRFQFTASGGLSWGDGTAAPDTTLARTAAGVLTTGGQIIAGAAAPTAAGHLTRKDYVDTQVGTAVLKAGAQTVTGTKTFTTQQIFNTATAGQNLILLQNTSGAASSALVQIESDSGSAWLTTKVSSDTVTRFAQRVSGNMEFGPGNASRDVTFYRSASGVLNSSGQLAADAAAPTAVSHLTRKDYVDTAIGTTVKLTGNQSIDGVKTFTSLPVIPTNPTSSGQAAAKGYVDTAIAAVPSGQPGIFNVRNSPYNAVGNGTTNDAAAIQAALDAAHTAGGGIVLIPGGYTYAIGTFLVVYDRTTIWAYGATLKSIGNTGLIRNFLGSETFSGYAGHSHIRIYGGTWDGNAGDGTSSTTTAETDVLNFVHASNIVCRDLTVQNVSSAHGIEFNSIDGGVADNCRILGFRDNSGTSARQYSEAIQVDIAVSGSSSIGNFDNTPCKNITIRDCYVGASATNGAFGKLVGSHTAATGVVYDNINVLNNTVDTTLDIGIRAYAWQNSEISGNRINNAAGYAISAEVAGTTATRGLKITDNVIENGSSGGITVIGASGATMTDVDVSRNNIKGCASAGLSINYADYPTIEGNNVDSSGGTGIFVTNGTGGTISSNKVINSGSNGINITAQNSALLVGNTVVAPQANYNLNIESLTDVLIVGNYLYQPVNNKACINFTVSCNNCTATANRLRAGTATAYAVRSNATNGQSNNFINNDCKGFGNTAIYYGSSGQTSGFVWNTGSSGTPNGVVNLSWTNTANTGSNIV